MRIKPFFRWFDMWIGAYVDVPNRALYVCPVPMLGVKISLDDDIDDAPYVCPGCYAVGGERCAPGCIDAEIAREAEFDRRYGIDDEDDEPCDCAACEDPIRGRVH